MLHRMRKNMPHRHRWGVRGRWVWKAGRWETESKVGTVHSSFLLGRWRAPIFLVLMHCLLEAGMLLVWWWMDQKSYTNQNSPGSSEAKLTKWTLVFSLYFHIVFLIREAGLARRTYMNIPNTAWHGLYDGYVDFLVYPSTSHELRVLKSYIHSCVSTTWSIVLYKGDNLALPKGESPKVMQLWGFMWS